MHPTVGHERLSNVAFIIHCILTFLSVLGFISWVTAWEVHSFPRCHTYVTTPKCKILARWQTVMGTFSVLSSFSPYRKTVLEHFALGQLSASSVLHQCSSQLWGPVYNSEHLSPQVNWLIEQLLFCFSLPSFPFFFFVCLFFSPCQVEMCCAKSWGFGTSVLHCQFL